MSPHLFADLVSRLVYTAKTYHAHESLRDHIAHVLGDAIPVTNGGEYAEATKRLVERVRPSARGNCLSCGNQKCGMDHRAAPYWRTCSGWEPRLATTAPAEPPEATP